MRTALSRVVAWFIHRSGQSGEADETGDESGSFTGSLLDASVNRGHGQGDPQAASEMAAVQEEADRLTQADQHRE
ncbi:hypothetical protein ACODNH_13305 [Haloarcula sp. NS06]|uniref:hypothetical protein n=1 Tax=unclassified Haloarcula TaxID=2624677 RepID=UPI0027B1EAB6|nr:hypothetical protein [Haloarcula sp. H-GB4]MDQ2071248.1 hypothetical protein [Haloarcula sp. H-GB4]